MTSMRSRVASSAVLIAGLCVSAACAHHRPASSADRFFLHKEARTVAPVAEDSARQPPAEETTKLRELMASARPAPREAIPTLETSDPTLAAALKDLSLAPTAENQYAVGAAYHRRGLLDQAFTYYSQSLRLSPRRPETHEALARLWRDGGLAPKGLVEVHRAIYYSPSWAPAHNTLGTLLQAIGRREDARNAYERAVILDGHAGYAFNNLCYLSFVEGKAEQAMLECQTALHLDPSLSSAHNNLGLIHAAGGRLDLARREFELAGPSAFASYNMGIVYLSQNRYSDAAGEFDAADEGRAGLFDAARRARDARQLAQLERQNRGEQ
jgi:Flp pilus assembly protein TadD